MMDFKTWLEQKIPPYYARKTPMVTSSKMRPEYGWGEEDTFLSDEGVTSTFVTPKELPRNIAADWWKFKKSVEDKKPGTGRYLPPLARHWELSLIKQGWEIEKDITGNSATYILRQKMPTQRGKITGIHDLYDSIKNVSTAINNIPNVKTREGLMNIYSEFLEKVNRYTDMIRQAYSERIRKK